MGAGIQRRHFLSTAAAAAVARPLSVAATVDVGPVIAVLYSGDPIGAQRLQLNGISKGLPEFGWVPGTNCVLNHSGMYGAFDAELARALIDTQASVIGTVGQATALAVRAEARIYRQYRVVLLDSTDAVEAGLVDSLEAPGSNVTGLTVPDPTPQLIQLARRLVPAAAAVGMVVNVSNPIHARHVSHAERAAGGFPLVRADLSGPDGIEAAFDGLAAAGVDAIVVPADEVLAEERTRVSPGPRPPAYPPCTARPATPRRAVWRRSTAMWARWRAAAPATSAPY